MSVFSTDPVLKVLTLIKTSWNLPYPATGSITFATYWNMSKPINHWIVVKCLTPRNKLLTTDSYPLYQHNDVMGVEVIVRGESDSGTAVGQSKQDVYNMQKEVERILLTGSRISTGVREEFVQLEHWREMDQDKWLPYIFKRELQIDYWRYEPGST